KFSVRPNFFDYAHSPERRLPLKTPVPSLSIDIKKVFERIYLFFFKFPKKTIAMKAVILKGAGDVSQLAVEEIAAPTIEADEMLIRTRYFSINPIEIKTRKGNRITKKLLADKPSILGWDLGGVVEKVGKNVKGFSQGDPVFGVIGFPDFGKTYAEYVAARPKDDCKIPENVDFDQASVCTIAGLTAYQALKYHGKLAPGKRVLIHAASGGVGH